MILTDELVPSECNGLLIQPQYKGHESSHVHLHVSTKKHLVRIVTQRGGNGTRPVFVVHLPAPCAERVPSTHITHDFSKENFIHHGQHYLIGPPAIHDGNGLRLGKEILRVVQQITLVIATTSVTAFPFVRSPLQGLTSIVRDVKRHPHAFFTIAAQRIFVGIESVEEETIFPVAHFLVQGQDQRFQALTHVPVIGRSAKVQRTFDFSTQSLERFHGVGSRFQQILNGLSHHESETLRAQKAMSVFQTFGSNDGWMKEDLVHLLHVGHHAPIRRVQHDVLFLFQQGKDLSSPFGASSQQFGRRPIAIRTIVKQQIKHQ